MTAMTRQFVTVFHLPRWVLPRLPSIERRRRQTTIDLIHSSPHLLRDIGVTEENFSQRRK